MSGARKPSAGQRVIKVRNVRLALSALTSMGIDLEHLSSNSGEDGMVVPITVDNVISGHSREVLALLWAIAREGFVHTVPVAQLRTEVTYLEHKLAQKGICADPTTPCIKPGNATPVTNLLFRWVCTVCGLYGVTVRSCSTSFLDGSALCLLVHHYVPSLISWSSIAVPPAVPHDVAEQILDLGPLANLESLSWADYLGMQNVTVQADLEQHRCATAYDQLARSLLVTGLPCDVKATCVHLPLPWHVSHYSACLCCHAGWPVTCGVGAGLEFSATLICCRGPCA
jgi:Calponin homology (CH) domain